MVPTVQAQDPSPKADLSGVREPAQEEAEDQKPVYGVRIEDVTLPVTVTDPKGEFVIDLDASSFRVIDNGVEQKILGFELSWEPVSMVIAVETSSRVESAIPEISRAGILFTQLVIGETSEAAIITFDDEIKMVQEFTGNSNLIENAFRSLKPAGEDVRLSDAISYATTLLQRRRDNRRKVIVVMSEARNIGSSNSPGLVLRNAQQLGISIYTVGLSATQGLLDRAGNRASPPFPAGVEARPQPANHPPTPDAQTRPADANVSMLPIIEELVSFSKNVLGANPLSFFAQGTGAREFSAVGDGMEQAISKIGRELRSQYLLAYRPNNLDEPGFHHIRVTVSQSNLRVRTLPGYMFTRPSASAPSGSEAPIDNSLP